MKKLITLISFFLLLSCSNEENAVAFFSQNSIIGKWKITEYSDGIYDNIDEVEANEDACFSLQEKEFFENQTLDFKFKTGSNCQNNNVTQKKYKIEGNILTETIEEGGVNPPNDYIVKYRITELSANTLKIEGYYVNEGVNGAVYVEDETVFYETWVRVE